MRPLQLWLYGGFLYLCKSSILDWDFPWNKPSSYWGTPHLWKQWKPPHFSTSFHLHLELHCRLLSRLCRYPPDASLPRISELEFWRYNLCSFVLHVGAVDRWCGLVVDSSTFNIRLWLKILASQFWWYHHFPLWKSYFWMFLGYPLAFLRHSQKTHA